MGSEGFETKKIFVGGIPRTVNEDEFGTFFSHFGEIKEHRIIRDHSTGGSRGFGFITFQTEQAVDDLLGMGNKLDFAGAQVDIKKAVPKKPNVAPPPSKHYSRPAYGLSRYAGFGGPISTYGTSVVGSTYSSRSAYGHIRYYGFAFGGSGTGIGFYGSASSGSSNGVLNGCYELGLNVGGRGSYTSSIGGGGLYSYKGASYSMSGYYRGYGNAGSTTCFTPRGEDGENSNLTWSSKWSTELLEEMMHLILQRLCIRDYLQFPQVCCSWRQAGNTARASKNYRPSSEIAWLTVYVNRFFSPSQWKVHKTIDPKHSEYAGSFEGWLIEVNHWKKTLKFRNPISRCKVKLPSPDKLKFHKIASSSIPTNPHCVVASLSTLGKISFCRPSDESWTLIDQEEIKFGAIEVIDWKLYAATNEKLMVFDLSNIQDANVQLPSYRIERTLIMLHPETYRSRINDITDGKVAYYLAKDSTSKELFMIFIENTFAYDSDLRVTLDFPPHTKDIHLFKLEVNNNRPRWVEVVDLGARMLFLSKTSNVFISIIEYSDDLTYGLHNEATLKKTPSFLLPMMLAFHRQERSRIYVMLMCFLWQTRVSSLLLFPKLIFPRRVAALLLLTLAFDLFGSFPLLGSLICELVLDPFDLVIN